MRKVFLFLQQVEQVVSESDDEDLRTESSFHPELFVNDRQGLTDSTQHSARNFLHLADENRYLNDELNRVETILNLTRAEKDELTMRYGAVSDRVRFEVGGKSISDRLFSFAFDRSSNNRFELKALTFLRTMVTPNPNVEVSFSKTLI